jgi:group I intron endonuclease
MKQIGIYKITSPTKKIYIGQSVDIRKRWMIYKRLDCKNQPKLYNSFIKYGVDKHKFEIVQLCDREQLNDLEIYYIELFQVFNNKYGLNLQAGGHNGTPSEETKLKISLANKGRIFSDEHKHNISLAKLNTSDESKLKMSITRKGRKLSEETKKRMSESSKGMKHTIETRKKMSEWQIGKIVSNDTKNKIGNANMKLILNIETGIFYHGTKEAALAHSINQGTLKNKLGGFYKNDTNLRYV